MTSYSPVKKAYPITREQLAELKEDTVIYLANRRPLCVKAVGRRWVTFTNSHYRMDLRTGLAEPSNTGCRNEFPAYYSLEDVDIVHYNSLYVNRVCNRLREALNNSHRISVEQAITLEQVMKGLGIKI